MFNNVGVDKTPINELRELHLTLPMDFDLRAWLIKAEPEAKDWLKRAHEHVMELSKFHTDGIGIGLDTSYGNILASFYRNNRYEFSTAYMEKAGNLDIQFQFFFYENKEPWGFVIYDKINEVYIKFCFNYSSKTIPPDVTIRRKALIVKKHLGPTAPLVKKIEEELFTIEL